MAGLSPLPQAHIYDEYITNLKQLATQKKRLSSVAGKSENREQGSRKKRSGNTYGLAIGKAQTSASKKADQSKAFEGSGLFKTTQKNVKLVGNSSFQGKVKPFLLSGESNPEVALKGFMAGIISETSKRASPKQKNKRASSAKPSKQQPRSNSHQQISPFVNQSFTSQKGILFNTSNLAKSSNLSCYMQNARSSSIKQPSATQRKRPVSNQKVDPSVLHSDQQLQLSQSLIEKFKNSLLQMKKQKRNQPQQPQSQGKKIETVLQQNATKLNPEASRDGPGMLGKNQFYLSAQGHITDSTEFTDQRVLINSLEQQKFLTNQVYSNTQNSNTLYSLQHPQPKQSTSIPAMKDNVRRNGGQATDSLNPCDITSFNIDALSNQILFPSQMVDVEDLHAQIVSSIQMQRKVIENKDCLHSAPTPQKSKSKRESSKSRCSNRKQSGACLLLDGDEVIGGD